MAITNGIPASFKSFNLNFTCEDNSSVSVKKFLSKAETNKPFLLHFLKLNRKLLTSNYTPTPINVDNTLFVAN